MAKCGICNQEWSDHVGPEGRQCPDVRKSDASGPSDAAACSPLSETPETDELVNRNASKAIFAMRLEQMERQRNTAIALLKTYRNKVPLGHQPHMIAHVVDQFLSENASDVPCADARPLNRD